MENYTEQKDKGRRFSATMAAALVAAALVVGAGIFFLGTLRSDRQEKTEMMQGAFREGSPEFEALTRKIVTETEEATQATTPLGAVVMTVNGRVRNNSDRTIVGLEARVSILDSKGNPVKEKIVVIVPGSGLQKLGPDQEVRVVVPIDGFKENDDRADIRWKVTAIKPE